MGFEVPVKKWWFPVQRKTPPPWGYMGRMLRVKHVIKEHDRGRPSCLCAKRGGAVVTSVGAGYRSSLLKFARYDGIIVNGVAKSPKI